MQHCPLADDNKLDKVFGVCEDFFGETQTFTVWMSVITTTTTTLQYEGFVTLNLVKR